MNNKFVLNNEDMTRVHQIIEQMLSLMTLQMEGIYFYN